MSGTVDAAVVLAGAPTAALIDLDAQRDMVLLSLDESKVGGLFEEFRFYQPYDIPAGTYPDQTEPVTVVNDPATIFTSQDADEELIKRITAAIFNSLDELAQVHPQADAISLDAATNRPIDLHPSAQAYFDGAM